MNQKDLSQRLISIANMVTPGNRFADIGCDHGFLAMYLIDSGICPSGIASDLREGPLLAARTHIQNAGMADRIKACLGDGLEAINPGEIQTIILAGMGGPLMMKILSDRPEVRDSASEIIIEPQSRMIDVRSGIIEQKLCILDEDMVFEDGKYYPVLKLAPAKKGCTFVDESEAVLIDFTEDVREEIRMQYGTSLIYKSHSVFKDFLNFEYEVGMDVCKKLSGKGHDERHQALMHDLELNRMVYKLCE